MKPIAFHNGGNDFRIEYTRLSILKSRFPNVPIMALTATADRLTRDDIVKQLSIPYAKLFITSFDRKNISLRVVRNMSGNDKFRMMVKFIESHKGRQRHHILHATCRHRKTCSQTVTNRIQCRSLSCRSRYRHKRKSTNRFSQR